MMIVPIPPWSAGGVIPPVSAVSASSANRSPYLVSLSEVVLHFRDSADRRAILDGFLRYRQRLHAAGLVHGFQWLDGSFLEQIELLEGRPPNDLDVVTFFHLPPGANESDIRMRFPDAFPGTAQQRRAFQASFHVDAYWVNLDEPVESVVELSTYWYSMWSHRRDASWKGYVQVDLGAAEDIPAADHLNIPPAT
jgi:hypothetical protein